MCDFEYFQDIRHNFVEMYGNDIVENFEAYQNVEGIYCDRESFESHLQSYVDRCSKLTNFYNQHNKNKNYRYTRFLFLTIEYYERLFGEVNDKSIQEIKNLQFYQPHQFEIEHIIPQTNNVVNIENINDLGNLTLLDKSLNGLEDYSDKLFARKKAIYNSTEDVQVKILTINDFFENEDVFEQEQVDDRRDFLLRKFQSVFYSLDNGEKSEFHPENFYRILASVE